MPLTLKAFLSHRYQSPGVNSYFHQLFSEVAELQFDVDAAKGATNMTRLERMVRDTDAFVGIYPYDSEGIEQPTRQQLLEASRYFRLELDLAARARTPSIVFVDRRYGPVIGQPPAMFVCQFDHQEVTGRGGSPNRERFRSMFQRFCENVEASMQDRANASIVGDLVRRVRAARGRISTDNRRRARVAGPGREYRSASGCRGRPGSTAGW